MIPATFDYVAPATLAEALAVLAKHGDDAKVLTGGHSLIPVMKLRLARPAILVDLRNVRDLRAITSSGGTLAIAAGATHHDVMRNPLVIAASPLLTETASTIGDVQVRNVGTIGGSVVHADPAADWPAALLALDARMTVVGLNGTRTIPAAEFFVGMMESALKPGEILTQISVPLPAQPGAGAYVKVPQSASGFALAGAAVQLETAGGRIKSARVAITGVAATPFRARGVETALAGAAADDATVAAAAESAATGVVALGDLHASPDFRLHLARVTVKRALVQALARASAGAAPAGRSQPR